MSDKPVSDEPVTEDTVPLEDVVDRVFTIPNVVTVVRLACLPLFVWLLVGEQDYAAAAILLAVLGATDFVDGYLARHLHQTSRLGQVLDPVADRLLFFVGITAILYEGVVPPGYAWAILVREVLVAGATLLLAAMGARRIDVTWWGKAGTFANMFAFPLFVGSYSDAGVADLCWYGAWIAAIPGLILSWYAALLYIPIARRALAEGRAARVRAVASEP